MDRKIGCTAALTAGALLGCSVHAQAPIKAVAYDFSDRDFYDRSYAPSPDYGDRAGPPEPRIAPPAGDGTPACGADLQDAGTRPAVAQRVSRR